MYIDTNSLYDKNYVYINAYYIIFTHNCKFASSGKLSKTV